MRVYTQLLRYSTLEEFLNENNLFKEYSYTHWESMITIPAYMVEAWMNWLDALSSRTLVV